MSNKVKKLTFALENLTYNCSISNEIEKLQILLPHVAPEKKVFEASLTNADRYRINKQRQRSVVLKYAEATTIKVFFTVLSDTVPEIELVCCGGSKCKIIGSFSLAPKSQQMVSFTTINGGLDWHVNHGTNDVITVVNGKKGPTVVLTAEDIKLSKPIIDEQTGQQKNVSIEEQLNSIESKTFELNNLIEQKSSEDYILTVIDNAQIKGELKIISQEI